MEKTLRMPKLVVKEHNFCAGCGHGICEKMLANLFEELGIDDRVICAGAVGCTCNMPSSLGIDWIQSQHGRAAAVAQGMKKVRPDNIVITYQGDGDAGAIGLAETLYAAKRNAGITVFFVNNGVFGMTGGQTAPTALEGWITTTAQHGTSYEEFGKPLLLAELVAQFDVGYVARGSIANFKELQKTKLTYEEDVKHVSFASLPGMRERTLVLNGLSKAFSMTGWRMGYIAAPANLIEPLSILNMYSSAGTSGFVQKAASVALAKELEAGAVEEMRLEFKRRRDYLLEEISKMSLFSCHKPEGAFYIFLNIKKTGMTSQQFSDYMLNNYHAAMVPGDAFGPHGEGYVRLSYATSMKALEECIEILNKVDKELAKP